MRNSTTRCFGNQETLLDFLTQEARRARKIYRYPHLHPDAIAEAVNNKNWNPRAAIRGGEYTAIIPFADAELNLVGHDELGAHAAYHINGNVNVTAFFMTHPMSPSQIKNGKMNRIIRFIENRTRAQFIEGESPSPLFKGYRESVKCWAQKKAFADFDSIMGIDLSRATRKGNWNGIAGGKARGVEITAQASELRSDIIKMSKRGFSNAEIARAHCVAPRTVQRHLKHATPAVRTFTVPLNLI